MILGEESMAQTISIGKQDFLYLRENNYFYIDKTDFIRQWWGISWEWIRKVSYLYGLV